MFKNPQPPESEVNTRLGFSASRKHRGSCLQPAGSGSSVPPLQHGMLPATLPATTGRPSLCHGTASLRMPAPNHSSFSPQIGLGLGVPQAQGRKPQLEVTGVQQLQLQGRNPLQVPRLSWQSNGFKGNAMGDFPWSPA